MSLTLLLNLNANAASTITFRGVTITANRGGDGIQNGDGGLGGDASGGLYNVTGGNGQYASGDDGGGGGGGINGGVGTYIFGENAGGTGGSSSDFRNLQTALTTISTSYTLGPGGNGGASSNTNTNNMNGVSSTNVGAGGGGAGYYGGAGGNGYLGGGGGGAAGYSSDRNGGTGGSACVIIQYKTTTVDKAAVILDSSSTSYTLPSDTVIVSVWLIGQGGNGGNASANDSNAGSGGGAGGMAYYEWTINTITYTGPTVINVSSVNHVMWSYIASTSNANPNSSSFTYTVTSDANSCIGANNSGTLTLSGNRGSVQVKISETGSDDLIVTLSIIVTPTLNNYNSGVTSITKFYNEINTSFSVTSPTSTTPSVGTPSYSYSIVYATNGPPSTPTTATVSSSSSSGATILINDTGQCFIKVTKAQDLSNFLDVAVSNIALTVRPGYIVGPNVDLTGAVIQNYDLNGVNFSNCNLTNARIINCLLANAIFTGANFTNATFTYNTITSTTTLTNADFTGLISNNNTGNTTNISAAWKIQGGSIVATGTIYFSITFTLASPSFTLPSGTGLTTSSPNPVGDGHYRINEGSLLINGKVESALTANQVSNFIVRATNTRYQLIEVGPSAKYTFELINSTASTGYSGVNTMYIRGIKTATNAVTRLRNISRSQTFAVSFQILNASVQSPYVLRGSYLFGPGLNLGGTYFDNNLNPKPDLTDLSFNSLSLSNTTTVATVNRVVAVGIGESNTLAYSSDGVTWIGIGKTIFETQGLGVAYSSILGQWVAVGEGSSHTIAYSLNGTNWNGAGKTIFSSAGYGVAYNPDVSMWVAVGQGTNSIAYSSDGANWTGAGVSTFSTSGRGVAYSSDQERWVAVGSGTNTIAYSSDGISWTGLGTSIFSNFGFGVAYSNTMSRWVAVGSGTSHSMAYSSDGISWTGMGKSTFSSQGYGVAYSSTLSKWVAVGSGTNTVAYSTNGLNWTGITVSGFTSGFSIGYNSGLSLWVAGGSGSNPVIYSSNGESWTASTSGTSVFIGGSQTVYGIGSSEASGTSGSSSYGTSSNTNTNTTLQGWTLTRTKFENGNFFGVCFSDCNCNATDFSGASLENTSFKITYTSKNAAIPNIATLLNSKFTNCRIIRNLTITGYDNDSATPLNQMNVSGLDFSGSTVEYITTYFLNRTGGGPINMLSEPLGRDLKQYGYSMVNDSLIGRFLAGPGTCLKELTLGNVDFSGTNLSNIDISGTNLASASLYGISMRDGSKTYYSNSTVLPSGYRIVKPKLTSVSNPAYIVGRGIDLSGIDARGLNFEFSDIRAMNFTNALFSGVRSVNMVSSTGEPTTFPTNAYSVVNRYFIGPFIDLSAANLSYSTLENSNMTGANLTNAVLLGATSGGISTTATIDGVQYTQQPIMPTGYALTRGYIVGPSMNLINTDLSGFDFTNVNLSGTNFTGSNLTYVISGNTTSSETTILPDASYAFLSGFIVGPQINLSSKNVSGVRFSTTTVGGFTLSGSLFTGANLTAADFSGITLDGVDFTNANFTRTSSRNIPQPTILPKFTAGQNAGYVIRNGYIIGANVDMSFTNLTGIDLSNTVLTGANFTGATLNGVKSGGGGITVLSTSQPTLPPKYKVLGGFLHGPHVDLSGANLSNLTFDTVSNSINWSSANLTNATFTNVKSGWIEIDSDASGPTLSSPYVYNRRVASNPSGGFVIGPGVNLSSANFTNFDLRNVLNVSNVNFTGAIFTNVKTSGAIATPSSAGNFPTFTVSSGYVLYRGFIIGPNVDMSGTDLSYSVFGTSSAATLAGSTSALSGINFTNANMSYANLLGSTVNGTVFTGANFLRTRTGELSYSTVIPLLPDSTTYRYITTTSSGGYIIGPGVDLTQTNLQGADFTNVNFKNVDMSGASIQNSTSENISYDASSALPSGYIFITNNAKLSFVMGPNLNLTARTLNGSAIRNVDLTGTIFTNAQLLNVNSSGLTFNIASPPLFTVGSGYKIKSGFLIGPSVDLSGASMSGVDLSDENLTSASFVNADMSGVNLFNSTISFTRFTGASFFNIRSGGRINFVSQPLLPSSSYKLVSNGYSEAVSNSGFQRYIVGPNANCRDADFSGAFFDRVDLSNVDFSGANFTNVASGIMRNEPILASLPSGFGLVSGVNTQDIQSQDPSFNNALYFVGPYANLSNAFLKNAQLINLNVTGINFTGADFNGLSTSGLIGTPQNLPSASYFIRGGYIFGPTVNLSGGIFTGFDISNSILTGANFVNSDFTNANLNGCNILNAKFGGSTMTGAKTAQILYQGYDYGDNLSGQDPSLPTSYRYVYNSNTNVGYIIGPYVDISGSDLRGSDLAYTNLTGINLFGADIRNVRSGNITINGGVQPTFTPNSGYKVLSGYIIGPYVDLRGIDFTNQDFSGTNLTGTIFTNSIFVNIKSGNIVASPVQPVFPDTTFKLRNGYIFGPNVDLSFSDLSGMDLSGLTLTNARMQNTNFTNVRSGGIIGTSAFIRPGYILRNGSAANDGYIIGDGVDLSGATLTVANLSNSFLTNVNLTNVTFSNASLLTGVKSGGNLRYNAKTLSTMPTNYTIRGTYIVGPRVDLSGANLTSLDLSNTVLTGVNMSNATFTNMRSGGIQMLTAAPITFSSAASYGSEFGYKYLNGYIVGPGVDLTGSNFSGVTFSSVDLSGVKLSGSNLSSIRSLNVAGTPASLPTGYKVTARYIIGPGLDMSGYNFTNGDFSGADITGSVLINANFTNTSSGNVTGSAQTRFTTTVDPVNIKYQLSNGYIVGPKVNLSNGDLSGVNVSGINLTNATLFNTKTGKITFNDQTVVPNSNYSIVANYIIGPNVNLTGVDFSGVDLRYTNLTNVDFSGANLFNVRSGFISGTPQQLPTFYSFIGGFIIGPNTDLSGADLSGGNLANVSIQGADLTNANFYNVSSGGVQGTPRAPLNVPYVVTPNGYIVGPNVNLNNALMQDIDLRGLTLTNAIMTNVDFTNTKFGNNIGVPRVLSPPYIHVQTTLSGGFIVGPLVDISYGNFSYANLATADLTGTKLSNATFFQTKSGLMGTSTGIPASLPAGYSILTTTSSGGYLVGPNVDLNDANLSGRSTVLAGLNITNALMDRVRFDGAQMGGGQLIGPPSTINPLYRFIESSASGGYIIGPSIDLSGANFSNTDVSFVYVDGINFTNTNFTNTKSGQLLVRAPGTGTPESPIQSTVFSPITYRLIFSSVSGGYIIGPNVNLSDANFTDTDISATFLTGVNMSNARLDNMRSGLLTVTPPGAPPTLPPSYKYVVSSASGGYIIGPNQNLVAANLTGADLSFCNFSGCNTLQTIFPLVPASLYFTRSGGIPNTSVPAFLPPPYKFVTNTASGGYIVGPFSDLSGANLESSVLTDTDISGADLANARLRFTRSGGIPNTSVPATLPPPYKFITNEASGGYIVGPFSDLSGANLESSVLTDTDVSGADFTNARLRFARSGGIPNTSVPATLPSPYKFITNAASGGYIVGPFSDLSGANLESSILTSTDISGANFTNARLQFAQSGGIPNTSVPATLPTPYKFITNAASGGYIVGPFSDLSGANLESSILTGTDISGANFTNARLRFARSGGIPNESIPATLPSPYKFVTNAASGGYIVGPFSDLSGANLESSILTDTDISGANFTNARLRFARSGGIPNTSVPATLPPPYKFITNAASGGYIVGPFSDLSGANMESSILTDTDISGADLTNARLRFTRSGGIPNTSVPDVLPPPYKFVTNSASGGYIVGPFSDLSGANFEASVLTDTDISSANLTNARLIDVKTGLLAVGAPDALPATYTFIRSAVTASGGYIVGTGVDLSGAVLTDTDLSGTVFTNINIQNARLGSTNLVNVRSGGVRGAPASLTSGYAVVNDNSSGAYIIGSRVDLSGANLTNYVLTGLDVTGANMLGAVMLNAKTGPNLVGPPAVFPSTSYNYVVSSASGGFLIGPGVDISGANLSNSNLSNYDFRGANLTGVDLSGCILTNVKSGQTTGPPKGLPPSYVFMTDNSFGAFLVGPNVDLSGANLTNCQFTGLNIAGASFTNAIMRNVKSGGGMIGPPASLPSRYRYVYDGSAGDNTEGYFIGPGVDLSGARLRNLNDSSGTVYNLDGAYLTDANITNANFNGSSMKNVKSGGMVGTPQSLPANFTLVVSASGGYFIGPESDLQNANLNNVILTGMNITQADMSGATFINTRTGGLIGPPRTLTGGYYFVQRPGTGAGTGAAPDAYILGPGVNLSAANLSGTDLTNFDMSGANLSNVTFTNTTLTNTNIFNANLSGINPGTPLENNFTVKQNLQLLKNRNNRSIQRIRLTDCSAGDIDVVDAIPRISYDPCYNRIYDYIRPLPTSVLIPDNSGNSNLSRLSPSGRVFYIPSGPGESFYVDSSATTLTAVLPTPVPGNTQTTQYYHDVSGRRIVETATGNTIRSVLVNGKVFLVFGASMLGISIIDVYRALGFPAIYEVYSYYGTRNLTLPEKVSRVNTVTGNGNVSLNWVPSFSDGKPRLGYVVEYTDTEPVAQLYVPWVVYSDRYPLTNVTITGLTNGKTYYFRVAAVNVIGTGAYSDIVTCVPGTRPDDVSTLFITSDASLSAFIAEWSDPFNQGYPIQTYTLRYRPATTSNPWLYTVINTDNPLLVRSTVQGIKSVLSYPLTVSTNVGLFPSLPPPAVQNLYQIQISATNILGTNEFANPAPVTNTTLLDTDSMTVVAPNVVYSRIGTLPQKVSMSSIIPTVIPDSGGKKVKLSWLVPTPYAYVPYAYAIKYTLLTDVSGVLVPPPANIPDASWNVISPSSFIVSYDEIRTAAEAGANTAVMTVISGLTNGQRYSFRVAALNAAGRGAYSDAIPTPIIPGSVPSVLNVLTEMAYTINTSTGGVIALYWISPNKNGYAVTTYRVRRRLNLQGDADWVTTEIAVPPGVTDTQPYRTLTTTGLVNGAIYEYQVAARNQLGWSEFSETLYAVPRKVPDPVSNVSASILNQGLKISWDTGGVNDGGYPITGYRVQYLPVTVSTPSDAWRSIDVDGIYNSTVEINGLVNGITHRIRVLQFNAIGSSVPELSGFIEAVPGVVSLPPTGLFITVGNTRVTVFWTAPTSTGTNDVSYYVVQYKPASDSDNLYEYVKNPGQTTPKQFTNENVSLVPNAPGYDAFFAVVEGLMNGTNYNVRVATVTQVGIGQWSLPLEGIPGTVPSKVM